MIFERGEMRQIAVELKSGYRITYRFFGSGR